MTAALSISVIPYRHFLIGIGLSTLLFAPCECSILSAGDASSHAEVRRGIDSSRSCDLFGYRVGAIVDVDGDGHHDILVSDPTSNVAAPHAGAVWVISSKTGEVIREHHGFTSWERFGSGMLIVPMGDDSLYLVAGAPAVPWGIDAQAPAPFVYGFVGSSGELLYKLSGRVEDIVQIGDLNDDGVAEFATTTGRELKDMTREGIVIHSGATGELMGRHLLSSGWEGEVPSSGAYVAVTWLNSSAKILVYGTARHRGFLVAVDALTGEQRLVWEEVLRPSQVIGCSVVVYQGPDRDVVVIQERTKSRFNSSTRLHGKAIDWDETARVLFEFEIAYGEEVVAWEDLDGDGFRELAVGCPTQPLGGVIRILAGNSGEELKVIRDGADDVDMLGFAMVASHDVTGDDIADLVVGEPKPWLFRPGVVRVYDGSSHQEVLKYRAADVLPDYCDERD